MASGAGTGELGPGKAALVRAQLLGFVLFAQATHVQVCPLSPRMDCLIYITGKLLGAAARGCAVLAKAQPRHVQDAIWQVIFRHKVWPCYEAGEADSTWKCASLA